MEPACGGYISGPLINQIPHSVGLDDLFEVLQVELGHINLIRNISPIQWNRKVQITSKYSLEMALHVYLKIKS